jgi:RND superfamily putative drug exporter
VAGRRSKWIVVAAWLALLAVFAPLSAKLPDATTEEYARPSGSQSAEIGKLVADRFPGGDLSFGLLVYRRPGGLTDDDRREIAEDAREAGGVPLVRQAIPPFGPGSRRGQVSGSGEVAFTVLAFAPGGVSTISDTNDRLREIGADQPGLQSHLTGLAPLYGDFTNIIREADVRLLAATGLLVLLILLAIYRSPLLALLPLMIVGTSYAITTGIVYVLAEQGLSVTSSSTSLLLVLMFGMGTDYCLLLVSRYSAALRRTEDPRAALAATIPITAPVIVLSGLTVIAALLALLASIVGLARAFAPVNAIGVAVVLVASITVFPAVLAALGRSAFWPRASRVAYDPSAVDEEREGAWSRVGRRIVRRPVRALAAGTAVLAILSLGLLVYDPDTDVLAQFRTETDATRGYEVVRSGFLPGIVSPTLVLVERRGGPAGEADIRTVQRHLAGLPGVGGVSGAQRRSVDGRMVTLDLVFTRDPFSNATLDLIPVLRERAKALEPDLRVLLGEATASRYDLREAAGRDFKVVAPIALLVIFATLVVLLRALVAPLYLLATVVLSFAGALGISLLFFQYGLGRDTVDPQLPLIAFIFLVALGSDYNIFLMSRVREEAAAHGTREGVVRALAATGSVITSAGLILAGTFAVLTVLPVNFLLMLGTAVAIGILIDTFLVRTIVVPALGWLFADRSWWPAAPPGPSEPGARR